MSTDIHHSSRDVVSNSSFTTIDQSVRFLSNLIIYVGLTLGYLCCNACDRFAIFRDGGNDVGHDRGDERDQEINCTASRKNQNDVREPNEMPDTDRLFD